MPKIGISRSGATLVVKDPSVAQFKDSYTDTIDGQNLAAVIQGKTLAVLPSMSSAEK